MLADTEAGSVIAAAQAGASWGYRLVLLQFALIPAMVLAQELAARLGIGTGQGLAQLALHRLGRGVAALLLITLGLSSIGALVTELSGLAGVARLYGVPVWQTALLAAACLLAIIGTGSYRRAETVAIAIGTFELAFIVLAWMSHPRAADIAGEWLSVPFTERGYLTLLAANIGTCIIPWAIFYQQSASVDKALAPRQLGAVRFEIIVGAVLCQVITAAIVVAAAAAFNHGAAGRGALDDVGDIALAFVATLGGDAGRVVFALGLGGGAMVAAIVVSLTASWAFGEVLGLRHALSDAPRRRPWYPALAAIALLAAAALVASGANLLTLAIAVGVLNAVLLPVVLGFLFHLACHALPAELRLCGVRAWATGVVFTLTSGLGLCAALAGLL